MKPTKQFPFEKARRITLHEIAQAHRAIEEKTGTRRPRRGRPAKVEHERYQAISIRLHPRVLRWAKQTAHKRGIGYQTVINELLLQKVS